MRSVPLLAALALATVILAGCAGTEGKTPVGDSDGDTIPDLKEIELGTDPQAADSDGDGVPDGVEQAAGSDPLDKAVTTVASLAPATFVRHVLPAVYPGHGLYEPTIDVGDDGAIYLSAHSQDVGRNPAPAYVSTDDGATWRSMAIFMDQGGGAPEQQNSAPLLSDEVFIVAADDGTAWGADCCTQGHFPLIGWCDDGATACYYDQNAYDPTNLATQAAACQPFPTTDRPWVAYANGMLLLVNNPGGGPLQMAAMAVPPPTPVAYTGVPWGVHWNLCATDGGHIPGIPAMRPDHFFAAPQPNGDLTAYHLAVGNAEDPANVRQVEVFANTHVAPAESDSVASNAGNGGQAAFDAKGVLYVAAMNNTNDTARPGAGGIHFAVSRDDAKTFVETTFRFAQPVSSIYIDGNKAGDGLLLNWGVIDDEHTDWYVAHVKPDADGHLRLEHAMLAVDDGYEASRHVQGAARGPDGRAYMAMSANSANPGGATVATGDTPLEVYVQVDGPVLGAA